MGPRHCRLALLARFCLGRVSSWGRACRLLESGEHHEPPEKVRGQGALHLRCWQGLRLPEAHPVEDPAQGCTVQGRLGVRGQLTDCQTLSAPLPKASLPTLLLSPPALPPALRRGFEYVPFFGVKPPERSGRELQVLLDCRPVALLVSAASQPPPNALGQQTLCSQNSDHTKLYLGALILHKSSFLETKRALC